MQAREEVFDKAGKRNAEELSALMDSGPIPSASRTPQGADAANY